MLQKHVQLGITTDQRFRFVSLMSLGSRRCEVARRPRSSSSRSPRLSRMGHTPRLRQFAGRRLSRRASSRAPMGMGRGTAVPALVSIRDEARFGRAEASTGTRASASPFSVGCGHAGAPAVTAITPSTPAASRAGTTLRRMPRSQTAAGTKDAKLPEVRQLPTERDGRPGDRSYDRSACTGEEGLDPCIGAEAVEVGVPAITKKGRSEVDESGQEASAESPSRVAHNSDGLDHWSGGDLAEGDGIEELRSGHPVVGHDGVVLHQRNDDETASIGQRTDLEGHPAQGCDAAGEDRCGAGWNKRKAVLPEIGEFARMAISMKPHPKRTIRGRARSWRLTGPGEEVDEPSHLRRTGRSGPPPTCRISPSAAFRATAGTAAPRRQRLLGSKVGDSPPERPPRGPE